MQGALFFYVFVWLLLPCGVINAQTDEHEAPVAEQAPLVHPNVTIDLNPAPGAKTVIPDKPKPKKQDDEANIYLNFENASLESVLHYLAEEKKINVLPPLKGLADIKITLSTRKPLTLERAWNILLTILDMVGFTINQVGDLYRVTSNKDKNVQDPLPNYTSKKTDIDQLPSTSEVVRYVYFMANIKKEVVQGILATMLEPDSVSFNDDLLACIIKDKSINIKAAMKIIKELDLGGLRESIKIIQLQETDAATVATLLENVTGSGSKDKAAVRFAPPSKKKETTYFSSSTKIIPYPAKNSLILLGTEKNINRIVDFVYQYLDKPLGSAKSRLHIKEVRYVDAGALATLVDKMIRSPQGSVQTGRYKVFEDVIIRAEDSGSRGAGSRIIVACGEDDWARIEEFMDALDKPQPQVAIEVMLVNLTESQSRELGMQVQSKAGKPLGMGVGPVEFDNLAPRDVGYDPYNNNPLPQNLMLTAQSLAQGATSYMTLGRIKIDEQGNNNIWALIRSRFSITHTQIIGQPYLIANNYTPNCVFSFDQTRRAPGALVSKAGSPQSQTQEDIKADTKVTLTPKINIDGVVDLQIKIDLNSFVSDADNSKLTRSLDTKSSMLSGEVLVLGGFKTSQQTISIYKTPILGDIPIIGNFFKSKSKKKDENYLYVFIRPSIIKPQFEGAPDEYTQLKLDYAKYQVIRNDAYAQDRCPIQRWFFKPTHYSVRQKLAESRLGIFAPIDDYADGKVQPRSVNIKDDPYFQKRSVIKRRETKLKQRREEERLADAEFAQEHAEVEPVQLTSAQEPRGLARIGAMADDTMGAVAAKG